MKRRASTDDVYRLQEHAAVTSDVFLLRLTCADARPRQQDRYADVTDQLEMLTAMGAELCRASVAPLAEYAITLRVLTEMEAASCRPCHPWETHRLRPRCL